MDDTSHWLHPAKIECPQCHQLLYRVDHSPFYDEDFLYCDHCPIHVEVSYYDAVYEHITEEYKGQDYVTRLRAIEARLKHCTCGGSFRHDASRRCLSCDAPVIADQPAGVDLSFWYDFLTSDESNLSHEELEEAVKRDEPYARIEDLWIET